VISYRYDLAGKYHRLASQGQLLAIPKSGVIAGVIIGIAAQDIKNQLAIWL
jgi:hypothetical protein